MTYRQLPVEEWPRLCEHFAREFGHEPPKPEESVFVIAEDGEELVGHVSVQLLLVVESAWVAQRHRKTLTGAQIMRRMLVALAELFPTVVRVFVKAPNSEAEGLCKIYGCTDAGKVLKGERNARWGNFTAGRPG